MQDTWINAVFAREPPFRGRDPPFCSAVEPCRGGDKASIIPNQNILARLPHSHRRIMLSRSTMDGRNLFFFFFLSNSLSAAHLHKVFLLLPFHPTHAGRTLSAPNHVVRFLVLDDMWFSSVQGSLSLFAHLLRKRSSISCIPPW